MPKYIANPIVVNAWVIEKCEPLDNAPGRNVKLLGREQEVHATEPMIARVDPQPGDYWVESEDGYVYIVPRDVFDTKYRLANDDTLLQMPFHVYEERLQESFDRGKEAGVKAGSAL